MIITYIKKWSKESKDEILKHLCTNLLNRILYKLLAEEENAGVFKPDQYSALLRFFDENEINDDYFFGKKAVKRRDIFGWSIKMRV